MNDKDISTSCSYTRDIDEVNVVVCKSHDRRVTSCVEAGGFDIDPGNGRRLCCSGEVRKAEEPQFTGVIESVWNSELDDMIGGW